MTRPHRFATIAAVTICLVSTQWTGTLFASDDANKTTTASAPAPTPEHFRFTLDPGFFNTSPSPNAFDRQVYQGRPYRMRERHDGAIAALMIGAAATITGTAILIYANRPDCNISRYAGGCGYGTKVVGGSVLAGGLVGLTIGAITW